MTQRTLNEIAQERFDKLRTKFELDIQKPIIKQISKVETKRIQGLLDKGTIKNPDPYESEETNPKVLYAKAAEAIGFVDDTFAFINSLNLPPQLSLAIGLIISGHKTNNKQDIANAVVALGEYVNGNT